MESEDNYMMSRNVRMRDNALKAGYVMTRENAGYAKTHQYETHKAAWAAALLALVMVVLAGCGTTGTTTSASAASTAVTTAATAAANADESTTAPAETSGEETAAAPAEKAFTLEELASYDGKDGRRAYVAVDGVVYDVTDIPKWATGNHEGNKAGTDLSDAFGASPHGKAILTMLNPPVAGTLAE